MSCPVDLNVFIETALALAFDAGNAIMKIYATDFDVHVKGDDSPVTQADTEAEKIILAGLRETFADIPVVAEEEASAGRTPEIGTYFILVDPLDGTKEFTHKRDAFTVNIALVENGVPIAGVVYAPAMKRTFAGVKGEGAFELINDQRKSLSVRKADPAHLVAVASKSFRDDKTNAYLEAMSIKETVSIGSSLKFCLIASGEADIYPRFGRTMEWDTAAGHAVLNAAGGSVIHAAEDTPLIYGKRNQPHESDFANPGFIARGDVTNLQTAVAV